MNVFENVTALIGRTPLVKVNKLFGEPNATVLAKPAISVMPVMLFRASLP